MQIYIKPVEKKDSEYIVSWRNSPEISRNRFDRTQITMETNLKFYEENVLTGKYIQFMVYRIDDDFSVCSYPVATIFLKNIDRVNHKCEMGMFPRDKREWVNEGQEIAIQLLLDKAFHEYGMHKVYTLLFEDNVDEASLFIRAGFTVEGTLKDEFYFDNAYRNVLRLSILEDNLNSVK